MALPPNQASGQGKLRRRRRGHKVGRVTKPKEGLGNTNGKPVSPPKPDTPDTPKFGPYRRRAEADAQLVYGDPTLRAAANIANAKNFFEDYKTQVGQIGAGVGARYAALAQTAQGPTVGPAVQTAEGDQAAASRAKLDQNFTGLLTAQGNAQQDYFAGRQVVGTVQELVARQQAVAQATALAQERAAYVVQQKGKYKDEAHQRLLEDKAFGLDVAKAEADVKTDRKKLRQDARKQRQENRAEGREVITSGPFAGFTKRQVRQMTPEQKAALRKESRPAGTGSDKPKFTPNQQSDARQKIRAAYQTVKKNDDGTTGYYQKIYEAMVGAGVDPLIARAAIQSYRGRIKPHVARALYRDYGIKVRPKGGDTESRVEGGAGNYSKGVGRPD